LQKIAKNSKYFKFNWFNIITFINLDL
jgi:hypothetical protein